MRSWAAWLAASMVFLTGCQSVAPPTAIVVPLRDAQGLLATCTGESLPGPEDCQSQGEQAYVEMRKASDAIAGITVEFHAIAADGCRTVTWTVTYASGRRSEQPTEVCGLRSTWTKGPVPDAAWRADGSTDFSLLPDFIPVLDGDRTAGWVASAHLFPRDGEMRHDIQAVLADDLVTVVGGMYPGVGFVPLGAEDERLSDPANRRVTLTIRNESDRLAVVDVTEARDEARGPAQRLAPPIVVAPGVERQVVIEVPRDRWSLNLRGDLGFFYSDNLGPAAKVPGFALVVTAGGVLIMEEGG